MKKIYLSITTLVVFAYADVVAQDGMSVGTNATPLEMLDVNGAIRIGNDFTGTAAAPVGQWVWTQICRRSLRACSSTDVLFFAGV